MPVKRPLGKSLLPARNVRLVNTARRTLDSLTGMYQQETLASIQSSGWEVGYYNQLYHGRICTCTRQSQLLDSNGNLGQGQIDSLLLGGSNGIRRYGTSNIGNPDGTVNVTPSETDTTVFNVSQGERDLVEKDEYFDLDAVNGPTKDERLYQRASRACGVCFTTGTVGGYDLMGGRRYVYDVDYPDIKFNLATIDRVASPNALQVSSGGSITFTDTWMYSPKNVLLPLAFNNTKRIDSSLYDVYVNNELVTPTNFINFFTGTQVTIRVQFKADVVFTHLEVIATSQIAFADFPDAGDMIDINLADALNQVTIVFPSYYYVSKGAIVIDNLLRLQRTWMIYSVVPRRNNINGTVISWEAQARVTEKYELTSQLLRYPYSDLDKVSVANLTELPQG